MRPISLKLRKEMSQDPFYKKCIWEHLGYKSCRGRIEWEHALIYSGRQINEKWAILPVCFYHHRGPGLEKNLNRVFAILRASEEELNKYHKRDWKQEAFGVLSFHPVWGDKILKFLGKERSTLLG